MRKNDSINNDSVSSALIEITKSISNHNKAVADIDNDINAEKDKFESLKSQIESYSNMDDEEGYLSLKQALRASEDRLEFLQKKRKAVSKVDEATLEADRSKFRKMQSNAINSGKDRLAPLLAEICQVSKEIEAELVAIDEAVNTWTMTYGQARPIQSKYLGDPSGTLPFVSQFCINYENRMKLTH